MDIIKKRGKLIFKKREGIKKRGEVIYFLGLGKPR